MIQGSSGDQEELIGAIDAALAALSNVAGRSPAHVVTSVIGRSMGHRTPIAVYRRSGETLWVIAQSGYPDLCDAVPVGSGVTGRVAATRRAELVDVRRDPDVIGDHGARRSMLAVPAGPDLVLVIESEDVLDASTLDAARRLADRLHQSVERDRSVSDAGPTDMALERLDEMVRFDDARSIVESACRIVAQLTAADAARAILVRADEELIHVSWRRALGPEPPPVEEARSALTVDQPVVDEKTVVVPFFTEGSISGGVLARLGGERNTVPAFESLRLVGAIASASLDRVRTLTGLHQGLVARSEFTRAVSHEFRTPLTAIVGYADLILEGGNDADETAEFVDAIRRNGAHLLAMVTDLLDIARSDAGRLVVRSDEVVEVADAVEGALTLTAPQAEERHVERRARVEAGLTVLGDALRVRQIIVNVVANAIKFAPSGTVSIDARDDGSHVVIDVTDDGEGMTVEELDGLFLPFTGRSVRDPRSGTGLGLVISRRLAEAMGGTLDLASGGPGTGTTATLRLPAAR